MFLPPPLRQRHLKDTAGTDPTVNLAVDFYDGFREGYGNLHDARKVHALLQRARSLQTARDHWCCLAACPCAAPCTGLHLGCKPCCCR